MRNATEFEFYAAVKKACDDAGIDETGRGYVEMTCSDNAFDAPVSEVWDRAIDTLKWFVSTEQLHAVSRNEVS